MHNRLLLYFVIISSLILSGCFIKGRVVDENGAGVAGVTIILSGAASGVSTTNRLGYYKFGSFFNKLPAGDYTVTPSGNTTPASKNVTLTLRKSGVSNPVNKVDFIEASAFREAIILAANDLGMHCMDKEFSVFSILPPFNVVNSQVMKRDGNGRPYLTDGGEVELFYDAVSDSKGSINTYSIGKTSFWQYADNLFGSSLQNGEGLTGLYMPEDNPRGRGPQPMEYNFQEEWYTAKGIPITPIDDAFMSNPYSLIRIIARDVMSGETIGNLDIVAPVATETDCQNCHKTGAIAAQGGGWSNDPDLEVQSKINILKLHDNQEATNLEDSQPVLCAQCHYSAALDLSGTGPSGDQVGKPTFSKVMHEYHGGLEKNNNPIFPPAGPVEDTCYQCHPGNITQCQRGAMKTGGMDCNDCHGDMLAVGGKFALKQDGSMDGTNDGGTRRPWLDLPRCQSCHTGDAISYLAGPNLISDSNWPFRLHQAFQIGDDSASPLLASNKRFSEDTNTLFRFSKGHGAIMCEGCHGSTHAIWPNESASANDNEAAMELQGYIGTIMECSTCHRPGSLPLTTIGPHGLHNVNELRWYDGGHENFYKNNKTNCKACHGSNLTGTPLAKIPIARSFKIEDKTVTFVKGEFVRCNRCHGMPRL